VRTFKIGNRRIVVAPRPHPTGLTSLVVFLTAVLGALLVGAVFLAVTGFSPLDVYAEMVDSALGGERAIAETLLAAGPLILVGLAAAIAFKMLIWNIGGEGQLLVGAITAAGISIAMGDSLPGIIGIPVALLAGAAGGALWAAFSAVPRVYLGTNEILTTLMLNFIALEIMNFLIFGSFSPWRDPAATQFPQGRPVAESLRLPEIWRRLDIGLIIAVIVAVVVWWLIKSTRWGYEVRVAGDSARVAEYGGIKVRRKILSVFLLSGSMAGLAGAVLVNGVVGAMEPRSLQLGLGFTGIIVAALARLNAAGIIPVALFIGALTNSRSALQIAGVPDATVIILQGAIFIFAVSGEWLLRNRVSFGKIGQTEVEGQAA
jgi:simple sugar transport system permease protein